MVNFQKITSIIILCMVAMQYGFAEKKAEAVNDAVAANLLKSYLSTINSYETNFEQMVFDGEGKVLQEARGQLWVQRPQKFHWFTTEPFEQKIISDGESVWLFDVDLDQVVIKTLDKEAGNTPALLLSGDSSSLQSAFTISLSERKGREIFSLIPKGESRLFEEMKLIFEKKQLKRMELNDSLGQKTIVLFMVLNAKAKIDPLKFKFNAPEGVDVIDER